MTPKTSVQTPQLVRIQKILSQAGKSSRRQAEELILSGRVTVNNRVVTELGTKADLQKDTVRLDGKAVRPAVAKVTFVLNKPVGVVVSVAETERGAALGDLLPKKMRKIGLTHVGRLDLDSQGALLLTNDGELAHRLTLPKFPVPKTYLVKIRGTLHEKTRRRMEQGFMIPDFGRTQPAIVKTVEKKENSSWIEITVDDAKNRQVRRMCETLGHHVSKIKRVSFGPVKLASMQPGTFRELTAYEYKKLYDSVALPWIPPWEA